MTQQIKKEARMDKLEEHWNGLQIWLLAKQFFKDPFLLFEYVWNTAGQIISSDK